MKFIRMTFAILVLHLITGCAFTPQAVELKPEIKVAESSLGQGRVIHVNVVDERTKTTLGTRGAGLGADLTLKGDLRTTIRSSTIGGLTRQGFSPTMETVPDARELRVEIRNLDYEVIRGFWQGTLRTSCSLKAICKQGTVREYEKLHRGKYEVGVQVVQSDERNNRFVNTAVSNALDSMLRDQSLLACLAAPALATSASEASAGAVGAASALSGANSMQKQASTATLSSSQYSTADAKTVAESLAALKILHEQGVLSDEEYMQKQREIINEHTRKTEASLSGDAPPESEDGHRVFAQEMRGLFSDRTHRGVNERGIGTDVYFRPDGRQIGLSTTGHADEGSWKISDDGKYCRQWNKWKSGLRGCFHMYKLGDGSFRLKEVGKPYEFTITKMRIGDPEYLQRRF